MTEIKSNIASINQPDSTVFNFLDDFSNFGKLMPEQVINWNSTRHSCSFTIKGMADLALKMNHQTKFSFISYSSEAPSPFSFKLNTHISGSGNTSEVQIILEADLNPMLKLMAVRPLQNFVNILIQKLKELLEAQA